MELTAVNAPYNLLYDQVTVATQANILSNQLCWLNKCLLYLPMWCKMLPSDGSRNTVISMIMFIVSSIGVIGYGVFAVLLITYFNANTVIMVEIVYSVKVMLSLLSRLYSLYYFWANFNYPWNSKIDQIPIFHPNASIKYNQYTIRLTILIVIGVIVGRFSSDYLEFYNSTMTLCCIYEGMLFVYIPLYFTIIVHVIICLKYRMYLNEVTQSMKEIEHETTIDMKQLCDKYEALFCSFTSDYHPYLRKSMLVFLISSVLNIWVHSYQFIEYGFTQVGFGNFGSALESILSVGLYAASASGVCDKYEEFKDLLWKIGKISMESNVNANYYNYLQHYQTQHPVAIRIGRLIISRRRSIQFVYVFLGAKFLSYIVHYIAY